MRLVGPLPGSDPVSFGLHRGCSFRSVPVSVPPCVCVAALRSSVPLPFHFPVPRIEVYLFPVQPCCHLSEAARIRVFPLHLVSRTRSDRPAHCAAARRASLPTTSRTISDRREPPGFITPRWALDPASETVVCALRGCHIYAAAFTFSAFQPAQFAAIFALSSLRTSCHCVVQTFYHQPSTTRH